MEFIFFLSSNACCLCRVAAVEARILRPLLTVSSGAGSAGAGAEGGGGGGGGAKQAAGRLPVRLVQLVR